MLINYWNRNKAQAEIKQEMITLLDVLSWTLLKNKITDINKIMIIHFREKQLFWTPFVHLKAANIIIISKYLMKVTTLNCKWLTLRQIIHWTMNKLQLRKLYINNHYQMNRSIKLFVRSRLSSILLLLTKIFTLVINYSSK